MFCKSQLQKSDRYVLQKSVLQKSVIGWLRLVRSLKLQISFAKEPYKRDDILQNIILRILLIEATPQHTTISIADFSTTLLERPGGGLLKSQMYRNILQKSAIYGVATISKLLQSTGLFCRIQSLLQGSFLKRPIIIRSLLIVATLYIIQLRSIRS